MLLPNHDSSAILGKNLVGSLVRPILSSVTNGSGHFLISTDDFIPWLRVSRSNPTIGLGDCVHDSSNRYSHSSLTSHLTYPWSLLSSITLPQGFNVASSPSMKCLDTKAQIPTTTSHPSLSPWLVLTTPVLDSFQALSSPTSFPPHPSLHLLSAKTTWPIISDHRLPIFSTTLPPQPLAIPIGQSPKSRVSTHSDFPRLNTHGECATPCWQKSY